MPNLLSVHRELTDWLADVEAERQRLEDELLELEAKLVANPDPLSRQIRGARITPLRGKVAGLAREAEELVTLSDRLRKREPAIAHEEDTPRLGSLRRCLAAKQLEAGRLRVLLANRLDPDALTTEIRRLEEQGL